MSGVQALPLQVAISRLESEGFTVITREIRSRKGLDAHDERVISQKMLDDGTVLLEYAAFITEIPTK